MADAMKTLAQSEMFSELMLKVADIEHIGDNCENIANSVLDNISIRSIEG